MHVINNDDMARWVNNSGLSMNLDEAIEDGRFWVIRTKGEALITTAKTIEAVKVLSMFGLTLNSTIVEQCDNCYGYSFTCAGQDYGPDDGAGDIIPVIWFCHDCTNKEGK